MRTVETRLLEIFRQYFSATTAGSIVSVSVSRAKVDLRRPLATAEVTRLSAELSRGLRLYLSDESRRAACLHAVQAALAGGEQRPPSQTTIPIVAETDIVRARSTGRDMCRELGFSEGDQMRMATAISELARNLVQYAGGGVITLRGVDRPRPGIEVRAEDRGPGIADLDLVLSDAYVSPTGMGIGLKGTRRLVDDFEISSQVGKGTSIRIQKHVG